MPRSPPPDPSDLIASLPMSDSLRALARRGAVRRQRKGVQIITEGEAGGSLFIVLSGRLRSYSVGPKGRVVAYGHYGPGEYVGEMSLDDGPRSANVDTVDPAVYVLITREVLNRHLEEDPHFAYELLTKVIRRARATTDSFRQSALNDVYGSLRTLLLEITVLQPDGTRIADPAPSQLEMSQALGCVRAMVGRVMKDLQEGGWVECRRRRIVILKDLPARW